MRCSFTLCSLQSSSNLLYGCGMCCTCFDSYLQISKREGKKSQMQRCPTRLIWSCFCSNRWFPSHVRMSLVISNSECIWAFLASQSCVKHKVNIVRKSDKKAIIKSSSYSSSSHDPKNILLLAFCPSTSCPSPQHPAVQVSGDGAGSSHSGICSTHAAGIFFSFPPSTSQEPAELFLNTKAIYSCLALSLHRKFPSPEQRSALASPCWVCALSLPSLRGQFLLQLWAQTRLPTQQQLLPQPPPGSWNWLSGTSQGLWLPNRILPSLLPAIDFFPRIWVFWDLSLTTFNVLCRGFKTEMKCKMLFFFFPGNFAPSCH